MCESLKTLLPTSLPVPAVPAVPTLPGATPDLHGGAAPSPSTSAGWVVVDRGLGSWNLQPGPLATLLDKKPASLSVLVGLAQGSPFTRELADQLGILHGEGVLVNLILVPSSDAPGGLSSFGAWARQIGTAAAPAVQLISIGVEPPTASGDTASMVGTIDAGLAGARGPRTPAPAVGLWWLGVGTPAANSALWTQLVPQLTSTPPSFVGASLPDSTGCAGVAGLRSLLGPLGPGTPFLAEGLSTDPQAPGAAVQANQSCLTGAVSRSPAPAAAFWRMPL